MALETVVDGSQFGMLAIGPADRILAVLEALAAPAKVDA